MTGHHGRTKRHLRVPQINQKSPWHLISVSLGWIALGAIWLFVILFLLALVGLLH